MLLESEFLYRLEFGSGEARRRARAQACSRRERPRRRSATRSEIAAPDAKLLAAADSGAPAQRGRTSSARFVASWKTRAYLSRTGGPDPQREALQAPTRPRTRSSSGSSASSSATPGRVKVFKDQQAKREASTAIPGRGSHGDARLAHVRGRPHRHVARREATEHVFDHLLTSDEFFVYHNMDNDKGRAAILEEWRKCLRAR